MSEPLYEFCVEGRIDPGWLDWFEGLAVTFDPRSNQTQFRGTLPDQSAVYGLFAKFRDLGLNLVFFARLSPPH